MVVVKIINFLIGGADNGKKVELEINNTFAIKKIDRARGMGESYFRRNRVK